MKRYMFTSLLAGCLIIAGSFSYITLGRAQNQPLPATQEAEADEKGTAEEGFAFFVGEEGVYGPTEGIQTIVGDAAIKAAGVQFRNLVIVGDLLIEPAEGDGAVELQNVTVTGRTVVGGEGAGKLLLKGSKINTMLVDRPEGTAILVAQDGTTVWSVRVRSEAVLEEGPYPGGGFAHIYHDAQKELALSGNFRTLTVEQNGGAVTFSGGEIDKVYIESGAAGTVFSLGEKALIAVMDLFAPIRVTGKGAVERVLVMADGSEMEKPPREFEFGEGKTITVAGRAVDESTKNALAELVSRQNQTPKTQSQQPALPTVKINKVNGLNLNIGQSGTRVFTVNPGDARLSVTSNNSKVATAAADGTTVTVNAISGGKATITVSAGKDGYNRVRTSFTVTVATPASPPPPPPPPAPVGVKGVEKFEPTFGMTVFRVTLSNTNTPEKYTVSAFGQTFRREGSSFELAVRTNELGQKTTAEVRAAIVITPN